MRGRRPTRWFVTAAVGLALGLVSVQLAAETLFWRNRETGQNAAWVYRADSTTRTAAEVIEAWPEPGWQMVAQGDFDGDGRADILWRQRAAPDGRLTIWFMNGLRHDRTEIVSRAEKDLSWRPVATGDFDRDGRDDIVWRNRVTGENALWLMNGARVKSVREFEPLKGTAENLDWEIVGTGDFGSPAGPADGKPDLLWRHRSNSGGLVAVWFMDLPRSRDKLGSAVLPANPSLDWRIVRAGQFNTDGHPDLLWRHQTLGLNAVWYMEGTRRVGATFLDPEHDTEWRLAGQDDSDSRWLLSGNLPVFSASIVEPDRLQLKFNCPPDVGNGVSLHRRLMSQTNWTTLFTNRTTSDYTDVVEPGVAYEYRAYRGRPAEQFPRYYLSAGIRVPPIEQRGQALLVVDQTLAAGLAPELTTLQSDLVGDGWRVSVVEAPRHDDREGANNASRVAETKGLIVKAHAIRPDEAMAVVLIGHVAVPYSGFVAADGHLDHQGAWPADQYYGDLDGEWTDKGASPFSKVFPQQANVAGDGKFDQDAAPSPLEAAVGRIDFANLPAFKESELSLTRRYLQKVHRYRHHQLAWQSESDTRRRGQVLFYNHFGPALFSFDDVSAWNAAKLASGLFGEIAESLRVGDFLFPQSQPALWGFLSAGGTINRVNEGEPTIEHSTAQLASGAHRVQAAFCLMRSSYMGDWNLGRDNFLRSLLTADELGLAAVWKNMGLYRFHQMVMGEHLGTAWLHMLNHPSKYYALGDVHRDLAILGDPTLRLNVVKPPVAVIAARAGADVNVVWSSNEADVRHHVYAASDLAGPFRRLTTNASTSGSFVHTAAPPGRVVYMVRALRVVTTGSGSYTNLSQGVFSAMVE